MEKIIYISVVPMLVVIAAIAARDQKPRRGIRLGFYVLFAFHAAYMVALLLVLPRFT